MSVPFTFTVRVFPFAGRSARSLLSEVWCASLGEAGIPYHVHAFGGECSASEINRINGAVREKAARVIIGAGGGKVLDAARCPSYTPTTESSNNTGSIGAIPTLC